MYTVIKRLTFVLCIIFTNVINADDIDLISSEQIAYNANILLIMDVSGSMDFSLNSDAYAADTTADPKRVTVLRSALSNLLNDPEIQNINFGLSSFAGDTSSDSFSQTAHGISYPVASIDEIAETVLDQNPEFDHPSTSSLPPTTGPDQTTRSYLQTVSDTWNPWGGTPIVDALFEAALYFRGLPTNWGRHDPSKIRAAHPSTYVGLLQDTTETTSGQQCNILPCSGTSCNATKTCETASQTESCSTPICGDVCNGPTSTTEQCPEGVVSCGNGIDCEEDATTTTVVRDCITNSELLCRIVHPTWKNCKSVTSTRCETTCPDGILDTDGECVTPVNECTESLHKQCEEDITLTSCKADVYECTTDVESCTHEECEDVTTSTTVLSGSAVFVSPIKEECPANGIILLSDGAPTVNFSADLASNMMGSDANNCDTGSDSGRCGVELAKYIAENDNNLDISGKQVVNTFTVGLSLQNNSAAETYLKSIASAGGGEFINAASPETLAKAFKLAIEGIVATRARSFTAPTYSIDTSTLLSNDSFVYVPLFDRKGVVWPGNLKKYKIENGVIKDKNGDIATDNDGVLLKTAKDLWATSDSDDAVRSGGAANRIIPSSRVVKTDNGSSLITLDESLANSEFGNSIDDAEKQKLITFIKGTDPDENTTRNHMGDIIHSKPIKLNRADGTSTIYVGTNEGYLHAINDTNGDEVFAFMPRELLKDIHDQYHKVARVSGHNYGVDGPITLWIDERNSDLNKVGNEILDSGERAYLFFGLRRGGKSYYALDVTIPTNPILLWKKSFGTAGEIGDSWSQPVLDQLKWGSHSEAKPVLVFGGGYNDNTNNGNAVFLVNALNITGHEDGGDVIWSTKVAESASNKIVHSIPSRIRVIDIDRNGSIDRLIFGDTGGNVWRVDLNAGEYSSNASDKGDISKAKLYKIASLGGTDSANRKFFEEPDVAIFRQAGLVVATIAIGSGDRTTPLESVVENKFFVLYDKNILAEPDSNLSPITMLSNGGLKNSNDIVATDIGTAGFRGWYKNLADTTGEKVLAPAVTYQSKVIFTTFGTVSVTPDACDPTATSNARLYILDLISGKEYTNVKAATGEILGKPQIYHTELTSKDGTKPCIKGDCILKQEIRVGKAGPYAIPNDTAFQEDVIDPETGKVIPNLKNPNNTILPRVYWMNDQN